MVNVVFMKQIIATLLGCRFAASNLYRSSMFVSLPEPKLNVSYSDNWMSVVCRVPCVVNYYFKQRFFPKLLAGFGPNSAGIVLMCPSSTVVPMGFVCCMSRSHKLNIDIRYENLYNLLV